MPASSFGIRRELRALVTGGSGALGSEICRALGAAGGRVAVGYLTRGDAADHVAAGIGAGGSDAFPIGFDVADPRAAQTAVASVAERLGGLDVLVHAAAANADGLLGDLAPDQIERLLQVNVAGAMYTVRAALPWLLQSGRGRVILMSSVLATRSTPGASAYAASKGAIEALTRSLAAELGSKRITVNAIAPGFVDAGLGRGPVHAAGGGLGTLVPARRPGRPGEIAAVARFLVSEEAAYVSGIVVPVDGGFLASARLLDRSPVTDRRGREDREVARISERADASA
ncbi:MAG: SDR family oxidoreductase [Hyphomicrobiales bacterium]